MEDLASSPLSWRTAPSTPGTPDPTEDSQEMDTLIKYRTARQLPQELRDACKVLFEEGLLGNALSLENELVTSPSDPDAPCFMQPPISHISFVSTLLVHPKYTTKAKEDNRRLALPPALTYLRNLLAIMGPGNARLNEAFIFKQQTQRRGYGRSGKSQRPRDGFDNIDEQILEELKLPLATDDSLWANAQDFWHAVGWAFNCSVVHRERWEYWKTWLSYMIDVMDADWQERDKADHEAWEKSKQIDPKDEEVFEARIDSILCQYISSQRGRVHTKRLIKSVFANGDENFLKQFPEVFAKEAIPPRKENPSRKRQNFGRVDLENGDFGGYGSSDDDADTEDAELVPELTPPGSSPEGNEDLNIEDDLYMALGGHESITLRLRLMALLSQASFALPRDDAIPISDLYFAFAENLHHMPIHSLSLFISTSAIPHFPQQCLSSLCQATINGFIDDKAYEPSNNDVTVENLVECFLPWAANTMSIEDNAKLSILIETLLRLYVKEPDIKYESSLEDFAALKAALEKGIKARDAKIDNNRRKRTKSGSNLNDPARFWLKCSGERMRLLMPVYEKKLKRARSDYESSQGSSDLMEH